MTRPQKRAGRLLWQNQSIFGQLRSHALPIRNPPKDASAWKNINSMRFLSATGTILQITLYTWKKKKKQVIGLSEYVSCAHTHCMPFVVCLPLTSVMSIRRRNVCAKLAETIREFRQHTPNSNSPARCVHGRANRLHVAKQGVNSRQPNDR